MAEHVDTSHLKTKEVIDELFSHPPVNDAELQKRLETVNATVARRIVVDMLEDSSFPKQYGPLFLAVMGHLGLGRQKSRLMRIALDQNRSPKDRLFAAMTITADSPQTMDMLLDKLGPDGLGALAELSLFDLLAMQTTDQIGESIATALENFIGNRPLDDLILRIETFRKGMGIPCEEAWTESLQNENLISIRKQIVDLIIDEASEEGIICITNLMQKTKDASVRRLYQAALLRIRSKRIDPNCQRADCLGTAYLSNCDGQGDFVLLGSFENGNSTTTVVELCLRAGSDARDCRIFNILNPSEINNVKDRITNHLGCFLVEIPISAALSFIEKAVFESENKRWSISEIGQALSIFKRAKDNLNENIESCFFKVKGKAQISVEAINALFKRPEYRDTWYFDLGDLKSLNIALPAVFPDRDEWTKKVINNLSSDPIQTRLANAMRHMSFWHFWNNEQKEAALCDAIARDVALNFNKSPLVISMLKRSAAILKGTSLEICCSIGNASMRQRFKMKFFRDITSPKGRDLARLDFVEATASALNAAFDLLSGELRPIEAARDAAAFNLGLIFADHLLSNQTVIPDYTVPRMSQALADICDLSEPDRHQIIMTVVPSLYSFVEEMCSACPVDCLKHPQDDVSDIFFMPCHPLLPQKR